MKIQCLFLHKQNEDRGECHRRGRRNRSSILAELLVPPLLSSWLLCRTSFLPPPPSFFFLKQARTSTQRRGSYSLESRVSKPEENGVEHPTKQVSPGVQTHHQIHRQVIAGCRHWGIIKRPEILPPHIPHWTLMAAGAGGAGAGEHTQ